MPVFGTKPEAIKMCPLVNDLHSRKEIKTVVCITGQHRELEWTNDNRTILITAHRRENLGEPMKNIFRAIKHVADKHPDTKAIYPIHMNPVIRKTANKIFRNDERIHIIEP